MTHEVIRIPLMAMSPGTERSLLVHRFGASGARPKAYLQAGIHADEIPGLLVLQHLLGQLMAADAAGDIPGEIIVVPFANPIGLGQRFRGQDRQDGPDPKPLIGSIDEPPGADD